jgi:iron complex outermembrane recepter protein
MTIRHLALALLASTALTSFAHAQTAAPAPAAQPVDPNAVAKPATPAPAAAPAPAATAAPTPPAPAAAAPVAPPKPAAAAPAPAPVAAAPTPAAAPKPVAAAPAPQAAPKAASDLGTVYVKQPEPAPAPALAQTGLTASPTDFAVATEKKSAPASGGPAAPAGAATAAPGAPGAAAGNTARPVGIGGSTGQDIGGGYMIKEQAKKSRSTVTRDAIDKQSPTSNPFQSINLLPGVIQSSTDNDGLQGGNIRLRGFNSDKIGLTIEGAPVNDSGNYALFPQEYTDAANIGQISVSPGLGEIDSPHIGATGGVINIYMRDPAKELGAYAEFSIGSHNTTRSFVRIDSGQVGPVRAFMSYSAYNASHWSWSPGENDRQHIDFKLVADLSPGNTVRFAAIYNDAVNTFYPQPTAAQFNANINIGYLNALPSSFFTPQTVAGSTFINQSANNAFNFKDYRINPFKNLILSAPSNFTISNTLKFDTIPYYWYGFGSGGGTATMNENAMFWGNLRVTNVNYGGQPGVVGGANSDRILYYNPSITETNRPGVINKFTYEGIPNHKIVAGHWFELAHHRQTAPYIPLNANGTVADAFAESNNFELPATARCNLFTNGVIGAQVTCPTGPMQRRDQKTTTMTNVLFAGDSWKITPQLTMDYGLKQVFVNREINNYLPGSNPNEAKINNEATLPQVGLSYKLTPEQTIFGSYGLSFRSPVNFSAISSVSNTSGAVTPAEVPKPEEGQVVEIGHRYQGSKIATSLTAFYGKFENFQQQTNIADPAGGTATVALQRNIGGLIHYGLNGEIGTAPIYNFRPYIGAELLKTELQDNLQADGLLAGKRVTDFLPTQGKKLPGAPDYSFGLGLDYDDGHFFANAAYKFIGPQQATFVNDEQMRAHGRLNLGIGYRFSDIDKLKQPEIRLNFSNVLDQRQLTGVFGNNTNSRTMTGINGSTITGGAPTYYVGQDFSFMLTFRAGL